jgi:serine/threonine-protein kinase
MALLVDQRGRWQRGERLLAEAYLVQHPTLLANVEATLDLIANEVLLRQEQGEAPRLDEYQQRFPHLAQQLARQFEVDHAIGPLATDTDPTGVHPLDGIGRESSGPRTGPADPLPARYKLEGEIGRGGMGSVLRGRDTELGREIAVKVLLETHADNPAIVRRFVNEARIASQLQHPGIAPVYDGGRAGQRPYFTMKLVQGETLAKQLAERSDPGQDRSHFLKVFEQVCQTLAYAHSRGVIHRDLKPSNVMVGAFGEVQVMDWGLAKVLASGGREFPLEQPETPSVVAPVSASRKTVAGKTEAGTALGTPAYMAPEQARGEVDRVDTRADVFGLGAILCEILTGNPPFLGGGREAMRLAQCSDVTDACSRLDRSGADADLVALAKRCLAPNPLARPKDAGQLAAQLTAYLESVEARLRQAELDRARSELEAREEAKRIEIKLAEERKRRKVQLALAAAVLLLVVGIGAAGWWHQQQRQQADTSLLRGMDEARHTWNQAKQGPFGDVRLFREAEAAARRIAVLAGNSPASPTVRRQAEELAEEIAGEAEAAARDARLRDDLLEVIGPQPGPAWREEHGVLTKPPPPSLEKQFAAAFRAWGVDVETTPTEETAARFRARPAAVVAEVVAALDQWAHLRQRRKVPWQKLTNLAQALDDDPGSKRRELRAMMASGDLAREHALATLALALRPVPIPFDGGWGATRQRLHRLVAATDAASEPVPNLLMLARALLDSGDIRLVERLLRAAVRARPRELALHAVLGEELTAQGRWQEAVEIYAVLRGIRPALGMHLAQVLIFAGRVEEGLALFERLKVERKANPWLRLRHGIALMGLGRAREAEAAFREAIRLLPAYPEAQVALGLALGVQGRHEEAEAAQREAIRLEPESADAHNNLGAALYAQRRYKQAEAAYREAIRLQPTFAKAHNNLGMVLEVQGRHADAEAAFRQAVRLDPSYAKAYFGLGAALYQRNKYKEAEAAFREAIRLDGGYTDAHNHLGNVLFVQNRHKEAEVCCRKAIQLEPGLAAAHNNLGNALFAQARAKEAEASYREAIRLAHDDPKAHNNLGDVLLNRDRPKEAEAAFRQAIRLRSDFHEAYCNLGIALGKQGRTREAEAALRKAIRLHQDFPLAHNNLGIALFAQGKLKDAEASFRQAIRVQSDAHEARNNLGTVLGAQSRYKEAETVFREALRRKPDDAKGHFGLGMALAHQGRFKESEAEYRQVVQREPDHAEAHCYLGQVLREQGMFREALVSLRRGHDLGSKQPNWPHASGAWVRECRRLLELDRLLGRFLEGDAEPASAAERLELIALCRRPCKRLHRTAVRLAVDAFAENAKLADDPGPGHRWNAARSAILAAGGQAEDARLLPDRVVTGLRRQALLWLRADLAVYAALAKRESRLAVQVRQRLEDWQRDGELASVRELKALDHLPADERRDWQRLWDDVNRLRDEMRKKQ